ncbi:MAG TPA: surface-adhesin E family protein [Gemmatimonadaceae bacterium]
MLKKMIPALIGAALLALPAGAQTATHRSPRARAATHSAKSPSVPGAWRSVYGDASVKVALDTTQTQRQSDGTYRVRLRWQYPTNQMIGTRHAYRTMIDRKLIDCTTQGIKPISAQTYDATGKAVSGYDTPDSQLAQIDWAKRPSGSSAGKAYAAVCGQVRK